MRVGNLSIPVARENHEACQPGRRPTDGRLRSAGWVCGAGLKCALNNQAPHFFFNRVNHMRRALQQPWRASSVEGNVLRRLTTDTSPSTSGARSSSTEGPPATEPRARPRRFREQRVPDGSMERAWAFGSLAVGLAASAAGQMVRGAIQGSAGT